MKQFIPSPNSPSWGILARATFVLLLFSLGYTLGYIASTSRPKPQLVLQFSAQPQPLIKSTSETGAVAAAATTTIRNSPLPSSPPPHDFFRFRNECAPPVPQPLVLGTLLEKLYNNISPYTGFPTPETTSHLLPPSTRPHGWGSTNPVFADLIAAVRPRTIIELGTFLGASALHMASLTRHNFSLPDTIILCADDFRGWPGFRGRFRRHVPPPRHADSLLLHQFMLSAAAAGESGRLLPLPFSTSSVLQALCEWGVYGDLVEVDAGHDFHSAWSDINRAWAVVRPGGGVLFGHDYHTVADDRGVRRAVTLFAKTKGLTVRPHGQHWVLSPKPRQ